jgi:hypothetical protein
MYPEKDAMDSLFGDLEKEIAKEFELDPNDPRLRTAEGRNEIIQQFKSDFEKTNPTRQEENQKILREIPGLEGGETARTTIEQNQKKRDFINLQNQVTANELASARPIGDIISEATSKVKEPTMNELMDNQYLARKLSEQKKTEAARIEAEKPKPATVISGQASVAETNKANQLAVEKQRGLMRELEQARQQATRDQVKTKTS